MTAVMGTSVFIPSPKSVDAVSVLYVFFSSRRRHTRLQGDWSSDVCSSDLRIQDAEESGRADLARRRESRGSLLSVAAISQPEVQRKDDRHYAVEDLTAIQTAPDRKSTRLNSSHLVISYAVFCLKKKKT